jgi:hypothetical protein
MRIFSSKYLSSLIHEDLFRPDAISLSAVTFGSQRSAEQLRSHASSLPV